MRLAAALALVLLWLGGGPALGEDITGYAQECAAKIAPVPAFDCTGGTEIPITVNGKLPASYAPGMSCDRPSLLPPNPGETTDGQCVAHSRILKLRDDSTAQISAICRQKIQRPADAYLYDEVDIVLHGVASGSTCWFHAMAAEPRTPARGLDGRHVPSPGDGQRARDFWSPPAATAKATCVSCHDASPFLYSPFVAQTGLLPADPFGRYANDIGKAFAAWPPPRSIATSGNACTACHRIGSMNSCHRLMLQAVGAAPSEGLDGWGQLFPQSHWMPPGDLHSKRQWDAIYGRSVAALVTCCQNPGTPGCILSPMPEAP
jgi:hypothetical protein